MFSLRRAQGIWVISLLLILELESRNYQFSDSFTLDVATYLEQVEQNNEEFIASKQLQKSYSARAEEGSLLFAPQLVSSVSRAKQNSPQFIPNFPIYLTNSNLTYRQYNFGVQQETPMGLQWRLENNSNFFQLSTAVGVAVPILDVLGLQSSSQTWSVAQSISVKQPLWKNGFGESTRAKALQARTAANAQAYEEGFKLKKNAAQAENIYWQLVLARELKEMRLASLKQAEKLLEYVEEKKRESLVLESDVYQARSILNINRIDYEKAKESESAISLTFNSMRGVSSSVVGDKLMPLSIELIDHLTPKEKGTRGDLKAQEEAMKSQEAQNVVSMNEFMPNLDLTASFSMVGNSPGFHESLNLSFNKPALSSVVMVQFSIPLAPFKMRSIRRAYNQNSRSARMNFERMRFVHDQQWDELMTRLSEHKKMLELLIQNVVTQEAKFENAKSEYERGLTTFFVVTNCHSDYQSSKIAILQTFETILQTLLNLGLYEGGK